MLKELPVTHLLKEVPDVDGVDLWYKHFTWDKIPVGYGCYAFYRENDGKTVYIGSACAESQDISQRGLRMRLRFYRGRGEREKPTSTVRKVRTENTRNKLLLRCWVCSSPGSCRKYEEDALREHKPMLNWMGTREVSPDEHKARKRRKAKRYADKIRKLSVYDPEAVKRCPACNQNKPCREFARHAYTRLGVRSWCKKCMNVRE